MKELSPQAQAVMEAAWNAPDGRDSYRQAAAAALRAAAEQMPSELPEVIHSVPEDARRWYRLGFQAAGHTDRSWLSGIAAELGGERLPKVDDRDAECVARWPDCVNGGYDPKCCRFPKSCSCGGAP